MVSLRLIQGPTLIENVMNDLGSRMGYIATKFVADSKGSCHRYPRHVNQL